MTKLFFIQKTQFFKLHCPNFWGKESLPEKSGSVTHILIQVSTTLPKFRKNEWSNSKKMPRQTAGQKGGQTLFHRANVTAARSPTSTLAVDWHLKIKDIEYNVVPTKNYCFTVSMQRISSIYTLILKIQQILGFHGLNK